MKSTNNKKAHQILADRGLIAVNKGILTMSNITQFSTEKQIQVSEHQLRRLLDFVNVANSKFSEVQVLADVIAEKSEEYSANQVLARLASSISLAFCDECLEELDFFKENSPQLVSTFSEELVA